MNIIDEINKQKRAIDRIRQKEAICKDLKIEWETDPKKMQFDKLRSYNSLKDAFDLEVLRVDDYDITGYERIDIFTIDVRPHLEIIDILLNGGKLIPPSKTEGYAIVDGEEKMVIPDGGLNDGFHRINVSKYFGLEVVPVVVFKAFDGYWFTPDKWSFDGNNGDIKATSIDGKVVTFKDYGAVIDDSNTEYLVIKTNNKNKPF